MTENNAHEELQYTKEALHEIERAISMIDMCHSNTIADLLVNQHLNSAKKLIDAHNLDKSLSNIITDLRILIEN